MKHVAIFNLNNPSELETYQDLLRQDDVETIQIDREEIFFNAKEGDVIVALWWKAAGQIDKTFKLNRSPIKKRPQKITSAEEMS